MVKGLLTENISQAFFTRVRCRHLPSHPTPFTPKFNVGISQMKSGTERGTFERNKFRKPDDGNLHNIDIRGGGRSWAGGAVGVHILSFHLEFMLVCMHLVLAKYFRSTVWWAHEGVVFNVHELHSAAVYNRLPHCRRVYSLLAWPPWPTTRPREWHRASRR